MKHFCASKDVTKNVKTQTTQGGKIVANHGSVKGFVPRIYKELL